MKKHKSTRLFLLAHWLTTCSHMLVNKLINPSFKVNNIFFLLAPVFKSNLNNTKWPDCLAWIFRIVTLNETFKPMSKNSSWYTHITILFKFGWNRIWNLYEFICFEFQLFYWHIFYIRKKLFYHLTPVYIIHLTITKKL